MPIRNFQNNGPSSPARGAFALFRKLASRASRHPLLRSLGQRFRLWEQPYRIFIAKPENAEITTSVSRLEGWFASAGNPNALSFRLNGEPLKTRPVEWPEVKLLFGDEHSGGFRSILDLRSILPTHSNGQTLTLELVRDAKPVAAATLRVTPQAIADAQTSEIRRQSKREWLKCNVACPVCPPGEGKIHFAGASINCTKCGETFGEQGQALDFLPGNLKREFQIDDADDFSAHLYDDVASQIIEDVRNRGGKVLDCGSGLRSGIDEAVICLEVAPLPTVDILGINQKLPFQNEVFNAVLSLNVLEHVTDPFTCASELVRVLKPGGTLYCCIPFLQPEHGYPHHYFNATRSGLRQLFPKNLTLIDHFVPRSGEPLWSLHWLLYWYARELPPEERKKFLNMRLGDIVDKPPESFLEHPWVTRMSSEGKWQLASTTAAIFRKS